MTINKSQYQTLKKLGQYLSKVVFSHGQSYVALLRITSIAGIKILIENAENIPSNYTKNII
ncbi:hypothetical protein Tsubulata_034980 [Turnera subulata]|uniref:Uncharacterized protein n=1 Tax=Turnera subulata TaxID=218843 RepID=A0A9Q0GF20_9ROSI|nr:hypothetical protein Tsubulata_034980 [Turnera subulata]